MCSGVQVQTFHADVGLFSGLIPIVKSLRLYSSCSLIASVVRQMARKVRLCLCSLWAGVALHWMRCTQLGFCLTGSRFDYLAAAWHQTHQYFAAASKGSRCE